MDFKEIEEKIKNKIYDSCPMCKVYIINLSNGSFGIKATFFLRGEEHSETVIFSVAFFDESASKEYYINQRTKRIIDKINLKVNE